MRYTIITVNKNDAAGLERTMSSVFSQTWRDYEYIVVDGLSSDGSQEVIEKYKSSISYSISEPDTGIYNAMNKGIRKATGDYVLFLNAGDYFVGPSVLECVNRLSNESDFLFGNVYVKGKRTAYLKKLPDPLTFFFFFYDSVCHQATFIKRDLFSEIGLYNEEMKIMSDWEFVVLALFKWNKSYQLLDLTIAEFNTRGVSSNKKNEQLILQERRFVLDKYFPYFYPDYLSLSRFYKISFKGIRQRIVYKIRSLIN